VTFKSRNNIKIILQEIITIIRMINFKNKNTNRIKIKYNLIIIEIILINIINQSNLSIKINSNSIDKLPNSKKMLITRIMPFVKVLTIGNKISRSVPVNKKEAFSNNYKAITIYFRKIIN
jgi:hypothetical protein